MHTRQTRELVRHDNLKRRAQSLPHQACFVRFSDRAGSPFRDRHAKGEPENEKFCAECTTSLDRL